MEQPPKSNQRPEDTWGTSTRVGYEDRPAQQPRRPVVPPTKKGNRFLRLLGGMLVVGSLGWIAYVSTSVDGINSLLKPGVPAPPVFLLAGGLFVLLLEKLFR